MNTPAYRTILLFAALSLDGASRASTAGPAPSPDPVAAGSADGGATDGRSRIARDGLAVSFELRKVAGRPGPLREGDFAEARFVMTDGVTGNPVPGLKPAVWMDMAGVVGGRAGESRSCKDRVALYLQGSVGIRPMLDLNGYYLLVLNQDASISVVDPVVSMTGNTSLFATIVLKRPGADWVRSADERRLYVSMPRADEIAVVDAEQFKLLATVPAGKAPTRLRLQGDGRFLWVGNDAGGAASGVTVIDTETLQPVATIATGAGHHELALDPRDRHVFVTNRDAGTVSVVDVGALRKVKDLATGPLPIAVATSPLSERVYVPDGKAGTVAVIDPARLEVERRLRLAPGLGPIRFSPDGRFGFVVNTAGRTVSVLDAAEAAVIHEIPVGGQPYQVVFTRAFAYVRLLDSEQVKMVNLLSVGRGRKPIVQAFGAGAQAPRKAGELPLADGISGASTDAAVFVASPGDNSTYFYMEGMNAPMGSYGGYGHAIRAVTVVDRSMKEIEPGVFAAKVRLPAAGRYDVAFLLDNPRILHCFGAEAAVDPELKRTFGALAVRWDALAPRPGEDAPLRFTLTDPMTGEPRAGLVDVTVLWHRTPGGPRAAAPAVGRGGGVYEARLGFPDAGTYFVFVTVPSLGIAPKDLPFRSIVVRPAPTASRGASR